MAQLMKQETLEAALQVILAALNPAEETESRPGYKPGQWTTGANMLHTDIDGTHYSLSVCINARKSEKALSREEKQANKAQDSYVASLKALTPEQRKARLASLKELEAEFGIE